MLHAFERKDQMGTNKWSELSVCGSPNSTLPSTRSLSQGKSLGTRPWQALQWRNIHFRYSQTLKPRPQTRDRSTLWCGAFLSLQYKHMWESLLSVYSLVPDTSHKVDVLGHPRRSKPVNTQKICWNSWFGHPSVGLGPQNYPSDFPSYPKVQDKFW